jgi:exosortase O
MAQGELGQYKVPAGVQDGRRSINARDLLFNLAILAAWLWLYHPLAGYLGIIFTRQDFRTNQILLAGILLLLFLQLRQAKQWPRLDLRPRMAGWPLLLVLAGSATFLLVERFLDVNTLSAALFGLASYGLLGLWLAPNRWRAGLPAALLLIGVLPFGAHLQTFVGYPLRIATARLVGQGLATAGVGSVSVDTILVFENGVSNIDLPCSGVQSLWTGALFLLAATWMERRALNGRWLVVAALFAALLLVANLARVAILISAGPVLDWELVAQMLHVPLGVLGFGAACAAAVVLLRRIPRGYPQQRTTSPTAHRPGWLAPTLLGLIFIASLFYAERPASGLIAEATPWNWPAPLATEPMPLKAEEREWMMRDGAESADRHRFQLGDLSGSMILISSRTWRAHHRPERCFEVYGLNLEDSRTILTAKQQPLRFVSLGRSGVVSKTSAEQAQLTAVYWFQSENQITDDYATRIWADLAPQRERWVLVSVLFDRPVDSHDPDLMRLAELLQETVGERLTKG